VLVTADHRICRRSQRWGVAECAIMPSGTPRSFIRVRIFKGGPAASLDRLFLSGRHWDPILPRPLAPADIDCHVS